MEYLRQSDVGAEEPWALLLYDGSLSLKRRQSERLAFFDAANAVLFLSIQAGGTGLHLVPEAGSTKERYCRAIVFWGARPYSPQQVYQTSRRIARIGQIHATEAHHIIADGSVDHGISEIHTDKKNLADAVMNGTYSGAARNAVDWRSKGRIVDNCRALLEDGRAFEPKAAIPTPPLTAQPASTHVASNIGLFRTHLATAAIASAGPVLPPIVPIVPIVPNVDAARAEAHLREIRARQSTQPSVAAPAAKRRSRPSPRPWYTGAQPAGAQATWQDHMRSALQQQWNLAASRAPPSWAPIPGIADHVAALAARRQPPGAVVVEASAALGAPLPANQAGTTGGAL